MAAPSRHPLPPAGLALSLPDKAGRRRGRAGAAGAAGAQPPKGGLAARGGTRAEWPWPRVPRRCCGTRRWKGWGLREGTSLLSPAPGPVVGQDWAGAAAFARPVHTHTWPVTHSGTHNPGSHVRRCRRAHEHTQAESPRRIHPQMCTPSSHMLTHACTITHVYTYRAPQSTASHTLPAHIQVRTDRCEDMPAASSYTCRPMGTFNPHTDTPMQTQVTHTHTDVFPDMWFTYMDTQ